MRLLAQGENLCFDNSVEKEKYVLKKNCSKGFKWLFEASSVKKDIDWFLSIEFAVFSRFFSGQNHHLNEKYWKTVGRFCLV